MNMVIYMKTYPHTSIGYHFASSLSLILLKGLGMQCYTKNYHWDNRKRKDLQCVFQYTLAGVGEIEIHNQTYKLQAGDAFFIDIPGPHSYGLPCDSSSWTVLYFEFSKEVLPLLHQLHTQSGPIFHIDSQHPLIAQALMMYENSIQNEYEDIYLNSKAAYAFLMDLSHYLSHQEHKQIPEKIVQCKTYIDMHFHEMNISLDEIAYSASLSKFHMTRLFEQYYGLTPGKYISELRMKTCAHLLIESDLTLDEIALKIGYDNGNYLSKVFKSCYGIIPSNYRKGKHQHDIVKVLFAPR